MRVGIDLDGVLFDFAESLRSYIRHAELDKTYNLCKGEPPDWYFYRHWGMTDQEFVKYCHDGVDAGFVFRGPARPNAKAALDRIRNLGHEIHIVTDRSFGSHPENSQKATYEWLYEHEIPFDTVTFSANKTVVPTDCFVEDKLENYDALKAAGVDVYLINRPWNIDATEYINHKPRKRIKDIIEYADIIEANLIGVF